MVAVEMGSWGCSGQEWRKGPWTPEEDKVLVEYVRQHGEGRWSCVSKCTGLNRSGKSCRLRWVNYLRPGLKKGHITPQEEGIIIELHALWGNKWSTIARYLPGRTDNEIKNYWRTHFKKRKPSSHDDDQNQSRDKRSSRTLAHKQGKDDMNIIEASPSPDHHHQEMEATMNGKEDKKETDILETSNIENPQSMLPMIMQHDYSWSDFIPVDNYNLWGGLWNQVDDQNGCSKMAIQNQVNVASNSRNREGGGGGGGGGGDAINYMHNGGFIF